MSTFWKILLTFVFIIVIVSVLVILWHLVNEWLAVIVGLCIAVFLGCIIDDLKKNDLLL